MAPVGVEFVMNNKTGAAHRVKEGSAAVARRDWSTSCGKWMFGRDGNVATRTQARPAEEALCRHCFPRAAQAAEAAEEDRSSSSSSTSSTSSSEE